MKEIKTMSVSELQAYRRELSDKASAINGKAEAEKRELTADEQREYNEAIRNIDSVNREVSARIADEQAKNIQRENIDKSAELRELVDDVRKNRSHREIVLDYGDGKNQIKVAGAVALNIHDIIPTLDEGLGLPSGVNIVTGVVGDDVWPTSLSDGEIQELGETEALQDEDFDFSNVKAKPGRIGTSTSVSNAAVDNAAFNVLDFVQKRITTKLSRYLAKKIYSQAAWTGIKGPFSGLASTGTITLGATAYMKILEAVADFANQGIMSDRICLTMDATTEAQLKATPKAEGQGGFIIEDGKCAGYEYTVSHYINTTLGTGEQAGKLVPTADKYLAIGCYDYLAVQFHGTERLSVDASSQQVALRDVTAVTLNSRVSITELTPYNNGVAVKPFALYKIATA